MGTFGYTTQGTQTFSLFSAYILGGRHLCPEDGVADSISVAIHTVAGGTMAMKCAIADANQNIIAETEKKNVPAPYDGWVTFNFASPKPTLVANTYYYLVVWAGPNVSQWIYWDFDFDAVSQYCVRNMGQSGPNTFPDPLGLTCYNDYSFSIYCTYSPLPPPTVGYSYSDGLVSIQV